MCIYVCLTLVRVVLCGCCGVCQACVCERFVGVVCELCTEYDIWNGQAHTHTYIPLSTIHDGNHSTTHSMKFTRSLPESPS